MAQQQTIRRSAAGVSAADIDAGLRAHMNKVYGTMSVGMLITALAAWAIAGLAVTTDPSQAVAQMPNGKLLTGLGNSLYFTPLRWVVMLAPFGIVIGLGAGINKLSASAAQLVFYVFAALMGVSISSIFLIYTSFSIVQIFLITAIAFASLSLYGYTTKRSLSAMGSFMMMGLVGIIIAMVVNWFLQSEALMYAISAIGVLVFAGLTAWDTQKIKLMYMEMAQTGQLEFAGKAAIMGALTLYLDFLNMFMMLLHLFGNRE